MSTTRERLIATLLGGPEVGAAPPVLVDIGASGEAHRKWETFARFSVCLAFDPDRREMPDKDHGPYRERHTVPAAVTDKETDTLPFYLTHFPYCSSALRPDLDALRPWIFADRFVPVRTETVPATTLPNAIHELGITRVDWIKVDSQGTDLRLLRSLGEPLLRRVLAVELEPGILDSYIGEDKLHAVMAFMDSRPFWMSDFKLEGSWRLSAAQYQAMTRSERRWAGLAIPKSPGWAEVTYLNTMNGGHWSARDNLVACAFALAEKQYGFALELVARGKDVLGEARAGELTAAIQDAAVDEGRRALPEYLIRKTLQRTKTYLTRWPG